MTEKQEWFYLRLGLLVMVLAAVVIVVSGIIRKGI